MGCDIHCYVEYSTGNPPDYWFSFGGRINPGRDYDLFARLAGVRNYDNVDPVIPPRGMPKGNLSWQVLEAATLFVTPGPSDNPEYCTRERADQWVKNGQSEYHDEAMSRVTHPDWHTHGWVTPEEFATVLDRTPHVGVEYRALLAAMQTIAKEGNAVRLVFWFDN